MPDSHIIIKPIHTVFISVGFIVMIVSAAIYFTSLRKDVDNLQLTVASQTKAINSLTKSINCHIMGGDSVKCIDNNSLSMK